MTIRIHYNITIALERSVKILDEGWGLNRFYACATVDIGSAVLIIIITLFQEDSIFGKNAILTYGPQLQYF